MVKFISQVRDFIQRGKRGFADSDLYDFDYYLSKLICQGLEEFKSKDPCFRDPDYEISDKLKEIDEIIDGFKAAIKIIEGEIIDDIGLYKKNLKENYKKVNKAFKLLNKQFFNLWY